MATVNATASQRMYPELVPVGATVRAENRSSLLRQRFAIFGGIAPVQPAQPRRGNPVAQLDNVHSVLRLNYETLRGLISFGLAERCKNYPF
jgi:hypothetical protein